MRVELDEASKEPAPAPLDLVDLDEALQRLMALDARKGEMIEMRYFGGMTAEETAEVVGRSVHIVQHELRFGHAWLRRWLGQASD